jgi:hypothetical protein
VREVTVRQFAQEVNVLRIFRFEIICIWKYGKWETATMERALYAFVNGDMGPNAAAWYTVFRKRCLRRTEGKNAIEYAQNFVPKCDFRKYRKWAANFALRKAFYGINKNFLFRLAYRLAEANSISHNFETKKLHSWENILHLYKTIS